MSGDTPSSYPIVFQDDSNPYFHKRNKIRHAIDLSCNLLKAPLKFIHLKRYVTLIFSYILSQKYTERNCTDYMCVIIQIKA